MLTALPWIKALHVIAIIAWMAGILYLFRLFVYHGTETEAVVRERLVVWERKLMNAIMVPAMVVAWACGLAMVALQPFLLHQPWFHLKLTCAVLMTGVHHLAYPLRRRLAAGQPVWTDRQMRLLNEVPTILMMIIVVMVIVRPWSH